MSTIDLAELAKAQTGDIAARNRIVVANIGLVRTIADTYRAPGDQAYDDIVQDGILGLMKAIALFDPSRAAFSTYASMWIRSTISRALFMSMRPVQIDGRNSRRKLQRSVEIGAPDCELARLKLAALTPVGPMGEESHGAEATQDADVDQDRHMRLIVSWLPSLPERQAQVVRLIMQGRGLAEIGRMFGISRERARQIRAVAVETLVQRYQEEILA